MKKSNLLLIAAGAVLVSPLALTGNAVHAISDGDKGPGDSTYNLSANTAVSNFGHYFSTQADDSAAAQSTAEFTVNGGALQLKSVPDLRFSNVSITTVANGGSQSLADNTVSGTGTTSKDQAGKGFDGNNSGLVEVDDYRGTGAGWTLSVKTAGAFTTSTSGSDPIANATLDLNASKSNNPSSQANLALQGTSIGATSTSVATAAKDQGLGSYSWQLNGDAGQAKVNFGGEQVALKAAAVYQNTLTWTLVAQAQ